MRVLAAAAVLLAATLLSANANGAFASSNFSSCMCRTHFWYSRWVRVCCPLQLATCPSAARPPAVVVPSIPDKLTGATGCIAPLRMLTCTVDNNSGFVAGISYSMGPFFGSRGICSQGPRDPTNFSAAGIISLVLQTNWNMVRWYD